MQCNYTFKGKNDSHQPIQNLKCDYSNPIPDIKAGYRQILIRSFVSVPNITHKCLTHGTTQPQFATLDFFFIIMD